MNRTAGILLSVTSLPSRYGIGCFSKEAYDFVDWLADAGQTYWQILPMGPTSFGLSGDSPYQSYSAFAGNPYLISLEKLIEKGLLTRAECDEADLVGEDGSVDFAKLHENRIPLLRLAYERSHIYEDPAYRKFAEDNGWWLHDYALFMALKDFFMLPWNEWPEDIRLRWGYSLDYYNRTLYYEIEFRKYVQFEFYTQWQELKKYANDHHIRIVGDMPIYVSMDSADVWAHPELFQLDENLQATDISGCPPDAFAADGQVWGNPLYRWDYHRSTEYNWWISRLWNSFRLFDVLRIDHFRGFEAYFSIPAETSNAKDGHWEKGPGMDLFRMAERRLGHHDYIAEDLGLITDEVRQLVRESGFPNMKVTQFAFDVNDISGSNDYLLHNHPGNCVAYTGTHDNETLAGWWAGLTEEDKQLIRTYYDDPYTPDDVMYRSMVDRTLMSHAQTCIVPIQDYIGLDNTHRMNQPGTVVGNWTWRLDSKYLTKELQKDILTRTQRYSRRNWANYKPEPVAAVTEEE